MPALPGCIISDLYADLSASGTMVGLASTITAMANVSPLFVRQSGGDWREQANIAVSTHTITGEWTIILPSQTNCQPDSVTWAITLPDGTTWSGAVTDAMVTASQSTALRLHDLKDTYGWALATPSPVTALTTYIATATALGMVTLDQNPSSGNPVVLTAPRRGAASGVCDLDSTTRVPLDRLPHVPFAQAHISAVQTIPPVTATALVLDVTDEDEGTTTAQHSTSVNPSRLTCRTAGIYQISAGVVFDDTGADFQTEPERHLWLTKNGSAILTQTCIRAMQEDLTYLTLSVAVRLLVADYIEAFAWHNARDASLPIPRDVTTLGSFVPYLTWVRLG